MSPPLCFAATIPRIIPRTRANVYRNVLPGAGDGRSASRTPSHARCHAENNRLGRALTDLDGSPTSRVDWMHREEWRARQDSILAGWVDPPSGLGAESKS